MLVFYALVFALLAGTLLLAGADAFVGTGGELESEADLGPSTYLLLLEGNLGFALAAVLVIAVG